MKRNRLTYYAPVAKRTNAWPGSKLRNPTATLRQSPADEPDVTRGSVYRSILVPLDGSNFAEHAIPYAVGLAERSGAVLKLVHVHLAFEAMDDLEPLYIDHATLQSFKRRKERYLNEVRRRISEVSSVRVSPYVITGHEVSASLREVDLFQADLVIIATHARGPIGRFWSGSVVHRLLRQVERPMMLVRGDKTAPGFAAKEIRNILIPLDGTSSAEQVLEPAVTLGGIVHAKHTLMQVVRLEPKHLIRHGSLRTDWIPSKRREAQSRRYLEAVAYALRRRSLDVDTRVVSSDDRIPKIISLDAEHCSADLIAITSSMRGPLSRIFRGSAQNWLIRNASVPILVVPARPRLTF